MNKDRSRNKGPSLAMLVSDWWQDTPRRATVGLVAAIVVLGGIVALYAALDNGDTPDATKPDTSAHTIDTGDTGGSSTEPSVDATVPSYTGLSNETSFSDPTFTEVEPSAESPWDDTTNMTSPVTSAPTPSTTAPDRRSPITAYSEEFENYCRWAFSLSPDGILYDPEFTDDFYVVDDCLYDLDPTWGDFYSTAAEAAQAGIDDAISALESFPLGWQLCWVDPGTEQIGGCWESPYSLS